MPKLINQAADIIQGLYECRDHSTASEWDLICGETWKLQLVDSGFFLGSLCGLLLFQQVAEELGVCPPSSKLMLLWQGSCQDPQQHVNAHSGSVSTCGWCAMQPGVCAGRRRTLGIASALTALSGMCSALAHSFWWYLAFRTFTGATVAGVIAASFLLSVEPVGPNYRGSAILSTGMSLADLIISPHTMQHSMQLLELCQSLQIKWCSQGHWQTCSGTVHMQGWQAL